jgi:hypothetical protein
MRPDGGQQRRGRVCKCVRVGSHPAWHHSQLSSALMLTQQGAAGASWLSCATEGRARRRRRSATQQGAVCASQGPPRNGSSSRSYGSDGAGRKVQGPQFRGGACTLARFYRRQPYASCVCSWPRRHASRLWAGLMLAVDSRCWWELQRRGETELYTRTQLLCQVLGVFLSDASLATQAARAR